MTSSKAAVLTESPSPSLPMRLLVSNLVYAPSRLGSVLAMTPLRQRANASTARLDFAVLLDAKRQARVTRRDRGFAPGERLLRFFAGRSPILGGAIATPTSRHATTASMKARSWGGMNSRSG